MTLTTIEKVGLIFIAIGVLAWPLGLWVLHMETIPWVLTWHLTGVIPGFIMRRWSFFVRIGGRLRKDTS